MTAVDDMSEFQTNFQMEQNGVTNPLISENTSVVDENSSEFVTTIDSMVDNESSEKSKISDVPQTNVQESISENEEHFSTLNQNCESEALPKTDNDEWLDILGSGDFKKKVFIISDYITFTFPG